jgi:hypothetical protein
LPLVLHRTGRRRAGAEPPRSARRRGWQEFQGYWAENGYGLWGPGAYIEQLVWYDQGHAPGRLCDRRYIYALAPTAGWETYDIRGPASKVLEQYLSVHAPS